MTPKEKANELVDKYYIICQEFTEEIQCSIQAKQCALISVEEIMIYLDAIMLPNPFKQYWDKVKHEINQL
jgi:hypothetical protein